MPKWLNSAAMPRPAARPAIGPIHERFGAAAAGAAGAFGAAAAAGVAGAFGVAAGVAGVVGVLEVGALSGAVRCMPDGRAPPRRLASESSGASVRASAASSINNQDLDILVSVQ